MKRKINFIIALTAAVMFCIPATLNAQEEEEAEVRVEKRIKIVSTDDKGERVVIDTILTGDGSMQGVLAGNDLKWISEGEEDGIFMIRKGDKGSFSVVTVDDEDVENMKNIMIHIDEDAVHSEKGNVIFKSSNGESHSFIMKVDEEGDNNIVWVSEPGKLEEGQVHITIKSGNEVDDFIIDGDAVITIKDGKIEVDGDSIKMNTGKEGKTKK